MEKVNRLVVKIGTRSLLTQKGALDKKKVKKLVGEIASLYKKFKEIVLVSSGAIISGANFLGLAQRPKSIPEKQAVASVGQIILMETYKCFFQKQGINIGQVLLTEDDLKHRDRYLNARNTILTLLEYFKVIPVINENDVVEIEEIVFGDNDVLAALVANLISADLLILLTNTEGFCLYQDGKRNLLDQVDNITAEMKSCAGDTEDGFGTGGMKSKIQAATISTHAGIPCIIANSMTDRVLQKIMDGEKIGTFFSPTDKAISQRKGWIGYAVAPKGKIVIDSGAKNALLEQGKSLLAVGIKKVEGDFKEGDPVDILDEKNNVIGRGLINYSTSLCEKIIGKKSRDIEQIVGVQFYPEVIHRDNLVIYKTGD